MIWSAVRTGTRSFEKLNIQTQVEKLVKQFVAFSTFYGEYMSLPPSERGKHCSKNDRRR
ncbi:hypothetical protein IFO70_18455 [Phormidium tenue FACHB-886]|nr:hypothetical protein [Phormidium tenue FACHB-886]